jgi:H+/gluconate symporter-like permease
MNEQIYILIGICILAFLIGSKLRKKSSGNSNKNIKASHKNQKTKSDQSSTSSKKEKIKTIFLYIQLILVVALLIFMIPALSRDLLSNAQVNNQNLVLRILIVGFAIYILVIGYLRLRKKTLNSKK